MSDLPLVLTAFDLFDAAPPPPAWVCEPFVPRGELVELAAPHAAFKSTIALDLCFSVATGLPWGDRAVEQGRAVYISLEEPLAQIRRRIAARAAIVPAASRPAVADAFRKNFACLGKENSQALILTHQLDKGIVTPNHVVASHVATLTRGASLIVLDTLARVHSGPETNEGLAALVKAIEHIALGTGAAVIVVRHMSKEAARDVSSPDALDSLQGRGGVAFSDAARAVLSVHRGPSIVTLKVTKSSYGAPGDTIAWVPVVEKDLGAVRLAPTNAAAGTDAARLLEYLRAGNTLTRSDLTKAPPLDLSPRRAKKAIEALLKSDTIVATTEVRSHNEATVYRARENLPVPKAA